MEHFRENSFFKQIVAISIICVALIACNSGSNRNNSGSGGKNDIEKLSGTAAIGTPIKNATVTLKDSMGNKRTTKTGADGKYTFDVTGLVAPYLVRVDADDSRALYAFATTHGVANIHPLSDLTCRNWFGVRSRDVDREFENSDRIDHPPIESELKAIKDAIRALLRIAFEQFGVGTTFDFDRSSFDADGKGFDRFLDHLGITIEKNKITIRLRDPDTGIQAVIVIAFDLGDDLTKPDNFRPSDPSGLAVIPASTSGIVVVWNSTQDNIGVAGYNVYRDGAKVATSPYPVFSDTGLAATTQYCYAVEAFDGAGNTSAKTAPVCATTLGVADTTAPSVPRSLSASPVGTRSVVLAWLPSPEDDVLGYDIYRGPSGAVDTKIATTIASGFTNLGLASSTAYCYRLRAFDAALNRSDYGAEVCTTTPPDTPPTDMAAPTSSAAPNGGTFQAAQIVTLSCNDADGSGCAAIYYTVDGSEPSIFSSVYMQPLSISTTTTLRFFAVDQAGNAESMKHSEPYVINTGGSNLIVNGSFELGTSIPSGQSYRTLSGGSTAITGWTVSGTSIDYIGPGWSVSDGIRAVDLDGAFSIGGIQQSFSTVPGKTYLVSFDLSGNPGGSPPIKQVRVAVDTYVQTYSFATQGQIPSTLIWLPISFSFTASTTNSILSFISLSASSNSWGALIDNIQVINTGNVETEAPTNTTGTNFINNGDVSNSNTSVTLRLSATDNAAGWQPISAAASYCDNPRYTLTGTPANGDTLYVHVWFKDAAGNVSQAASDRSRCISELLP